MLWIRSLLFSVLFIAGIVGFSCAILIAWPVTSLAYRRGLARGWSRYTQTLLARVCHIHEEISGQEHLPPPPYIVLSKHQSAWETVRFHTIFPDAVFVLKHGLIGIPLFGWALLATGQIFIDRGHGVEAMKNLHRKGLANLQAGTGILLFPEGTRVPPGTAGEYKAGGIGLALASGVPIVPVAHNAGRVWGKRAFLKHPGTVRLRIGPAIPTANLDRTARRQLLDQVRNEIEGMMEQLDSSRPT